MAAIPIAEIPNAPRTGDPVLTGGGGTRADISDTTRSLLRPTMGTEAVTAHSRALQSVAQGVADLGEAAPKVAAALDHWQNARTDGQDVINSNQRDLIRQDFLAKTSAELSTLPTGQQATYFRQQLPALREALDAAPISTRRADAESQKQTLWEKQNYAAVYTRSMNQTIEQGVQIGLKNYYNKLSSGDVGDAHQGLAEMRSTLLLTEEQYQDEITKGDTFVRRQQSEKYLESNPSGLLTDTDSFLKTGKPVPGFGWSREEARSYHQRAQASIVQREVQTSYTAHQAILKGDITDESTLRRTTGRDLPEARLTSLARLIHDDPAYDAPSLTQLRTSVRAFSPTSDRDQSRYSDLLTRIESTVPKTLQPAFVEELHRAWQTRDKPDANTHLRTQQATLFQQVDTLAGKGFIGDDDPALTAQKSDALKADLERFVTENPRVPSAQYKAYLRDRLRDDGLDQRAAQLLRSHSISFTR